MYPDTHVPPVHTMTITVTRMTTGGVPYRVNLGLQLTMYLEDMVLEYWKEKLWQNINYVNYNQKDLILHFQYEQKTVTGEVTARTEIRERKMAEG